jgi:hypothetical protein
VNNSDLCTLNEDSHTHLSSNGIASSPDISLVSAHLLTSLTWHTKIKLRSDHLPITVSFVGDEPPPRMVRTYTNFNLANWGQFIAIIESLISVLPDPRSCAEGERAFCEALLSASKRCILSGHRKNFVLGLPHDAYPLLQRRVGLRPQDPTDPIIAQPNHYISAVVIDSSRKKWIEQVESHSLKSNSSRYWSLLCNFSGKHSHITYLLWQQDPNQALPHSKEIYSPVHLNS